MSTGDGTTRASGRLEGFYANHLKVGHNAFEFLLDFCQRFDENEEAELCARIITNPADAKAMLATLKEAVEYFEKTFGAISDE
jgi:phage regulator Rha-like protein